jgi:hypothetical protein
VRSLSESAMLSSIWDALKGRPVHALPGTVT